MASGALLCAIWRGLSQFRKIDLIDDDGTRVTGAQPSGCSPIVNAFKSKFSEVEPIEHPDTIAKSLAIGDPGDGIYALRSIKESGGLAESATDPEILDATHLLAKTEGVFAEPAGSITVAVLKKLIELGDIQTDEKVVCCVTGNGFKTAETLLSIVPKPVEVEPNLEALAKIME